MNKMISLLALFSTLLFSGILASSLQQFPALSSVINNDYMLKILLTHVAKDLNLRLVSKTFMKAFDDVCSEHLLLRDPQLRSLIKDDNGQLISSPVGTFLPKSIPLMKLYKSYLNRVYPLNRKSFDEKFPVLNNLENSSLELESGLNSEYNRHRLIEKLRSFIKVEYGKNSKYYSPPMRLCRLYCLLVATFSEQIFINEIINSIDFPVRRLLLYAASGRLQVPYEVEILSRFSIDSYPQLIFDAINTYNPDLIRAILDNPQNDLSILKEQRLESTFFLIHYAAMKKNIEIINLLLERGFPADVKGRGGTRPIHLAAKYGNYDVVVKLFEFDKDVTSSPLNLLNEPAPIVSAAQEGHINIVEFFLKQDTIDMTNNQVTSRRLVEVALLRKDAKLGQLLIDSAKVKLKPAEIKLLRSLK